MKKLESTILAFLILIVSHNVHGDEACNNFDLGTFNEKTGDLMVSPHATSFLIDNKKKNRYHESMAFDGKLETSWVEGKNDDGIGEKIAFLIGSETKDLAISIVSGFGVKKYFKMNNRVKRAVLRIYKVKKIMATQCYAGVQFGELVKTIDIQFKDEMTWQDTYLEINVKSQYGFVGVLEIREVYRGTKWRDTCIAEIKLQQGAF